MPRSSPVTTTLQAGGVSLAADVSVPHVPRGLVVFAHGSGSSRASPRNQHVARQLVAAGFATLLFDLLTREEESAERYTRHLRFDIPLLAGRLVGAVRWASQQGALSGLPIGLFGASTGAAAALIAATRTEVAAVVSRGGRPDLAGPALPRVRCPTLFIVGGLDVEVLRLNVAAARAMTSPVKLHVVEGATHLFEEPGALDEVTTVATAWFRDHLRPGAVVASLEPSWDH
jgi:putative phosphoribosyl transferase